MTDSDLDELLDVIDANEKALSSEPKPPTVPPKAETDDPPGIAPEVKPAAKASVVPALDTEEDIPDLPEAAPQQPVVQSRPPVPDEDGDDFDTFFSNTGIQAQREVPDITKPWMKHHDFKRIETISELEAVVDECLAAGHCSLDLETQGLDSRMEYDEDGKPRTVHQIVGFCLSPGNAKKGYYAPVRHRPNDGGPDLNLPVREAEAAISRLCWAAQPTPTDNPTDLLSFREFKEKPKVVIDFWNAKFDQEFLYPVTGIDWWHPESFEDGLLACFVLRSEDKGLGLKYKAPEVLRDPEGNPYEMIKLKELFPNGRKIQFDSLAPDEPGVIKYACSDAVCTRLLCAHPDIVGKVHNKDRARDLGFIYRLEKQCIQVVRVMERNRVKVDREKFRQLLEGHLKKREEVRLQIVELAESKGFHGFEPGQTTVLSEFLFSERGLDIKPKPEKNEASGQYKTDASTIEQLVQEIGEEHAPAILKWIIEWREQDKVIGTYLEKLVANPDKNSELRFGFKETGAATGRFSAPQGEADQGFSAVPIHGIPSTSSLREGFIARDDFTFVKSDYAGQELRIATNVSGEEVWRKAFLEGDGDLHTITAKAFFNVEKPTKEQRKMGKIANFALIYGGGPGAIMRATGCDKVEASRRKQAFDKAVPTFARWIKGQHDKVRKNKGVWTAFGRWIAIPDIDHPEKGVQAACERHSTNYPIQGSGADIMKIALVLLHKEWHKRKWLKNGGDDSVRMLLTVHDEIVFEIRNDRVPMVVPIICQIMASPAKLPQPPFSPRWSVPLIVEPLLGLSWAGVYNWEMITEGRAWKENDKLEDLADHEVRVGDRVYHRVPPWLEGIVKPGWEAHGSTEHPKNVEATPAPQEKPLPSSSAPPAVPSSISPARPPVSAPAPTPKPTGKITTFAINKLSGHTVQIVSVICMKARDVQNGTVLQLVDASGSVLIPSTMGIKVNPEKFKECVIDHTLGDGTYYVDG